MVDGRLDVGELGGVRYISVSRDIFVFVRFPSVEQVSNVQVVSIISILGQIHDKVTLEINLFMAILQIFIPARSKKIIISPERFY